MTVESEWEFIIGNDAPERLRGLKIIATLSDKNRNFQFACEMPDDATPNEIGYFKWSVGEFVDRLKEDAPGLIGDSHFKKL